VSYYWFLLLFNIGPHISIPQLRFLEKLLALCQYFRPLETESHSNRVSRTSLTINLRLSIGTTYSCVAIYEGNNVEIIANEQGSFTTPSYVSFTEKERLIGEAAKNQAAMNPRNTIFDVK
jgi:hypothetical protein